MLRAAHHSSRRRRIASSPSRPSSRRTSIKKRIASPTSRPGVSPSCRITAVPSSSGRRAASSSAALQLGDAFLQLVHPLRQSRRLLLVACRAVATREHVEFAQEWPGVAHVTSHRRIRPTHRIRVEPQVQGHEFGHGGRRRRSSSAAHSSVCGSSGPRPHRDDGTWCPCPPGNRAYEACPRRGTARRGGYGGSRTSAAHPRRSRGCSCGGRTFSTTAIECDKTSLWRWIGSCSSRIAGNSGRN